MENLLRQGSERIEKTKSSFIQLNPFSSKLFHSCENITESFIHDLKPFPGTKLITRRSASGLAKETSGLVKGASGSLLDTKSASKTVSEHSLSNIQILGKILKAAKSGIKLLTYEREGGAISLAWKERGGGQPPYLEKRGEGQPLNLGKRGGRQPPYLGKRRGGQPPYPGKRGGG